MHRKLFCAAVLALLATTLLAQGSAPPVATTLTAPRVLDVIVSDARGNHIPGLTAADFRILQDGKAREITKFAELAHVAGTPDTHPPRMILAAFDLSSLSMQGRRKCVAAVRQLLKSRVRPNDRVMIAQVSAVGAATPVATWTSDPTEIERQLGVIEGLSVGDRSFERKNTEQSIEMAVRTDRDAGASGSGITFDSLMTTARHYASTQQAETRRTIYAIQDVLGLMGEGPGKKILILGGGGLSTRPGSEMFEYLETIKMQAETGQTGAGVARGAKQANPRAEISRYEVSKDVRDVALTARNHGIVVYALQPDMSGSTQLAVERIDVANTSADFAGVADQMSGYTLLAAATGGVPLLGGAPESAVNAIGADLDAHYSLSFLETMQATAGPPNVDVKLTKPGYRVRSAFAGGPVSKDSEMNDAVVANHVGSPATNDMNITVKSDEPVQDGINRKVTLTVVIPVKSLKLMPAVDEMVGAFTVYISTGDAQGHASAVNRQTKEVRFPANAVPQDKSIGFRVDVTLVPGRTQISVGVLDANSELTGYAKVAL